MIPDYFVGYCRKQQLAVKIQSNGPLNDDPTWTVQLDDCVNDKTYVYRATDVSLYDACRTIIEVYQQGGFDDVYDHNELPF